MVKYENLSFPVSSQMCVSDLSPGEGAAAGEAVVRLPSGAAGAGGGQVPGAPGVLPGQGITRSPHVIKFQEQLCGETICACT